MLQSILICYNAVVAKFSHDEQGTVWIQNKWGKTIDSVTYSSSWHSASLRSTEGVSLERLNYAGARGEVLIGNRHLLYMAACHRLRKYATI